MSDLELNRPVPDFELADLEGRPHDLGSQRGRIVIVNFWSCECPHSERTDRIILSMLVQWEPQVVLFTVASNRNETPADLLAAARQRRLPFVLRDEDCRIADLFNAQTTPHIFAVDREGLLRYRGGVDDVTFRNRTPTRFHLDEAVEAMLEGRAPEPAETPCYGCTIVREI